jgi:uncharacterized protein (UPF0216 family)
LTKPPVGVILVESKQSNARKEQGMSKAEKDQMVERRKVLKDALRKEKAHQFCDEHKVYRIKEELDKLSETLMPAGYRVALS